jgi:hypothetical protein
MSGEHGLPTASVVRSSQATPARRRGQPCTAVNPAQFHLSSPDACSDGWGHLSCRCSHDHRGGPPAQSTCGTVSLAAGSDIRLGAADQRRRALPGGEVSLPPTPPTGRTEQPGVAACAAEASPSSQFRFNPVLNMKTISSTSCKAPAAAGSGRRAALCGHAAGVHRASAGRRCVPGQRVELAARAASARAGPASGLRQGAVQGPAAGHPRGTHAGSLAGTTIPIC